MSYYDSREAVETLHESFDEGDEPDYFDFTETVEKEIPCPAHCDNGLVLVHGQETDCIECEGYGSVLITS